MLFPRTGPEISSEWLQMVIESYEKAKRPSAKIRIENFDVNKGTNPGENFNSELIRVEIQAKIQDKAINEDINYNLMLKFHSLGILSKEANRYSKNHIKELDIYSKIHNRLMELQEKEFGGKYKLNIPELIYGHNDGEDYVIVMRNLKPLGYTLNDRMLGLNFEQLKLAVNQIARWHALSYAYNEKFKLVEQFPLLITGVENVLFILQVLNVNIKNTYSLFNDREEWKEFFLKFKNRKHILRKMKRHFITKDSRKPGSVHTLVHGDYWNNNLLYLYSDRENAEERNPIDVSVVDWQMCRWNRSVIDLHYLLHTSTSYEVRKNHVDDLLLEYFTIFHDITSSLSTPVPDMTYESLKKDFKESSIVGFLVGLCYAQGTLSKAGEIISQQNSSSSNARGLAITMKTRAARLMVPMTMKSSFSFIRKAAVNKMLKPLGKEIQEGKNDVMLTRLSGLIQEAIDNGTLDDIKPISSSL